MSESNQLVARKKILNLGVTSSSSVKICLGMLASVATLRNWIFFLIVKKNRNKNIKNTLAPSISPEMHLLEKRRVEVGINWTLLFHKY
jgi:hypothetical protein